MKIILELKGFRVIEELDHQFDIDALKGDCFNPLYNPDILPEKLKERELEFEDEVIEEGVYGYIFEKWNPSVGKGWEGLDSCWGFIGQYDEKDNHHYIVEEMKRAIEKSVLNSTVSAIAEELRTQSNENNKMTPQPVFVVKERGGKGCKCVSSIVESFLTQKGAEQFIKFYGRNLKNPFIYVSSAFRNREWIAIRELLINNY